jgi:hypothetical protein
MKEGIEQRRKVKAYQQRIEEEWRAEEARQQRIESFGAKNAALVESAPLCGFSQSSRMDFTRTPVAGLPSSPPPDTPAAAILSRVCSPVSSMVPNTV